ncbi:MAG: dTDP-4-dehydrorhamnose 3,5-epimerase [Candidatus Eremiobacteraeota bacterium]|nr:dTDP-4-dehydrorhamnose 3,5-epimerase [Candidatus Eremiobacteraeota bacterium]
MKLLGTDFPEVKAIEPDVFSDTRGYFQEAFSKAKYAALGIEETFVQDNISYSHKDVLRGMHYDARMAKLVYVVAGRIFDVVVDVRPESPTFKRWTAIELSSQNHRQLFIPSGFAHGFLTLSDEAIVVYKQTAPYDPSSERGISWRDPDVAIAWPLDGRTPILSPKDAAL